MDPEGQSAAKVDTELDMLKSVNDQQQAHGIKLQEIQESMEARRKSGRQNRTLPSKKCSDALTSWRQDNHLDRCGDLTVSSERMLMAHGCLL